MTDNILFAQWAIKQHAGTNHLYDGQPYEVHLQLVNAAFRENMNLIPPSDRPSVSDAIWGHDLIEDCRVTYNDLLQQTTKEAADIIYAVTNEKGKTRKERANNVYYKGIRQTAYAPFVKLCDRIANVKYSKSTGSSMFEKYKQENDDFMFNVCWRGDQHILNTAAELTLMRMKLIELFD